MEDKEKQKENNWDFDSFLINDFKDLSLDEACKCCASILDGLEYSSKRK